MFLISCNNMSRLSYHRADLHLGCFPRPGVCNLYEVALVQGMVSRVVGFGVLWANFLHGLLAIPELHIMLGWLFVNLGAIATVFLQVLAASALFIARPAFAWDFPIS